MTPSTHDAPLLHVWLTHSSMSVGEKMIPELFILKFGGLLEWQIAKRHSSRTTAMTATKNKQRSKQTRITNIRINTDQSHSGLPWTLPDSYTSSCLHRLYTIHRVDMCDWHIRRCLLKEIKHRNVLQSRLYLWLNLKHFNFLIHLLINC